MLKEKIVIYEVESDDPVDMHYKVKEKIMKKVECSVLVLCAKHIILCQDKKLQSITFAGAKEKEWLMESAIRYIKVIGGSAGREGLLVGLKNGQILKVFIANAFPILVLQHNVPIRCLDLSANRHKLAVVDDHNTCLVYNIKNKELIYQEPNASSVAWNTVHNDTLSFSANNLLSIKASNFPVHQLKSQGFVVGFMGSTLYCLNGYTMTMIDVPHSASMYQYLEKKLYKEAYQVACLGVADADWETLAMQSLEALDLDTARKAFSRTRNYRYLTLVSSIEERQRHGDNNGQIFLADIHAYQAMFSDAARFYKKGGQPSRAMNMYTDLRMFDLAKEFVGSDDTTEQKMLITKQADWARNINEPKSAAEMYVAAGEYLKAIEIIADHSWADMLIDLARKLDKAEKEALTRAAVSLARMQQFAYAAEVYLKLGDIKALIQLYIESNNWDEAFTLVEKYPELKADVFLPYAQSLAECDKFEEAQQAFHQAGMQEQAVKVLEELTRNAVAEHRFNYAGFYYWKLSIQCLELATDPDKTEEMLNTFEDYQRKAEIYYVYHAIHRYTDEPFTSHVPETLFNMARFLVHSLMVTAPVGISKVAILYALAKQSRQLKAFKMARYAYEKLQSLRTPPRFQEAADIGSITIRSTPFHDNEELLPMCYRCSTTNPLLNNNGACCINCKQPFVFSFVSFEVLPVVEFFIEDNITDQEALNLLELESTRKDKNQWKEGKTATGQTLQMTDDYLLMEGDENDDPFNSKLLSFDQSNTDFQPIKVNRHVLKSLSRTEVIICRWAKPKRYQYYKVLLPDVSITQCHACHKLFHTDDYELQALQHDHCPYCWTSLIGSSGQ